MNFINKTKEGINSPTEKMESIHIQEDLKCFFLRKDRNLIQTQTISDNYYFQISLMNVVYYLLLLYSN